MQDDINNRMTTGRKRGRPSIAEIAAREQPEIAQPVTITTINLPPLLGFLCVHCRVAQAPRITQTVGLTRYCSCGHCGKKMRVDYSQDGMARTIQKL